MLINFEEQELTQRYKLMSQLVIPRPIAWVVTESNGVVNMAPFSYFSPLSSNPPTMMVSVGHRSDGTPKDTLRNLRETKNCVICMVDEDQLEPMHYSSKALEPAESESEHFNIETEKILETFPPMVKGVKTAFFCEYFQEIDLGGSRTIPVIVKIENLYIDESIIADKEKMHLELNAVGRVGKSYAKPGEEILPPEIP